MNIDRQALIQRAVEARGMAYAPYSCYRVGAALLTASGRVFSGCNVENAAYPETICAERTAVVKAISEGESDLIAIAVVTENAGSPCGACRQVLNEFSPEMIVLIADTEGNFSETTAGELLPGHFGPDSLK